MLIEESDCEFLRCSMDRVAVDRARILTQVRPHLLSAIGAGRQECVMARSRYNCQLCAGNVRGDQRGIRRDVDDLVVASSHDGDRN